MRHDETIRERMRRDVEALGVEEACRRNGVHRATWYRWTKSDTKAEPPRDRELALRGRIAALAAEHPRWGCDRIAFYLSFEGIRISSPTVQKHLVQLGLGRRAERMAATGGDEASTPPRKRRT